MRIVSVFVAVFLMTGIAIASEEEARQAAEKLLSMVGMEQALEKSIDQMLAVQIQQNPAMAPYNEVMKKFFNKYMSYESLKPDLVSIYAKTFTSKELNEIVAFYETQTGRKTITVMPELMGEGAQIGVARVQANIAELQEMIKAESERIKHQQSQ